MVKLLNFIITGAMTGLLYALVALGFVIIYRSARVFNFAQGELIVVGAFSLASLSSMGLPLWMALILAFLVSLAVGLVIERIIIRPLIGKELFALVMATIGLLILIRGVVLVIWGAQLRLFPGVFPLQAVKIGSILLDRALVNGSVITIVFAAFASWFFNRTRMGLEMTAVAEDHQIALSLGLTVRRSIAVAWAVSGVVSTMAGIIFLNGRAMTFLASDIGLAALPVALLAGLESVGGLILAGLIVGVSIGLASYFLDPIFQGGISTIFPFVIMIIILFIRPSGLFGWKTIERL
jgi:branched-chain amino acid transport system permease protein